MMILNDHDTTRLVHPLYHLTTLSLRTGKPIPSFVTILSNIVKHDGFFSIYKGVDAAIGRQLVYGTARIGLHRKFSDKLVEINNGESIGFAQKALSGMLSGSIAVCIGTPFDIALVRLQSDGMAKPEDRRNYKNVFDVRDKMKQREMVYVDVEYLTFFKQFDRH
jgi:solute carrier family 25 oxoglutarate transporter 11